MKDTWCSGAQVLHHHKDSRSCGGDGHGCIRVSAPREGKTQQTEPLLAENETLKFRISVVSLGEVGGAHSGVPRNGLQQKTWDCRNDERSPEPHMSSSWLAVLNPALGDLRLWGSVGPGNGPWVELGDPWCPPVSLLRPGFRTCSPWHRQKPPSPPLLFDAPRPKGCPKAGNMLVWEDFQEHSKNQAGQR